MESTLFEPVKGREVTIELPGFAPSEWDDFKPVFSSAV
jgi:hypothetical protein